MAKDPVLYEAMYILDTRLSEEDIAAADERLKACIEAANATFDSVHDFRRRRLAYKIGQHSDGFYRVMYFRGLTEAVEELKREFMMMDEVIRGNVFVANPAYMVGQQPQQPAPPEAAAEAATEEAGEEAAEEGAGEEAAAEAPAEQAPAEEAPAEEAPAEEAPAQEAAPEAPAQEAPAQAAAADEAPAEEPPAEEPSQDA